MYDVFGNLLSTGTGIFTGITNAATAKENAKAAAAAAKQAQANAAAQQAQQSSTMKYVLIIGGALVAVGVLVFALKRKG